MSIDDAADESIDFGVLLNLAFGVFKAQLHEELERVGFDDIGPAFGYVFRLLSTRPVILRELAQALGMSAPGALKIVNEMIEKGYVERSGHATDARQKLLSLTARGRKAMKAAHRFHQRFEATLAARFGDAEAAAARRVLEGIVEAGRRDPGQPLTAMPR